MQRFTASENRFGPYPTLVLRDRQTSASAEIALRGATLLSLTLPTAHGPVAVIGGYQSAEDFRHLTGARSAILVPYSNRIEDGRYQFDGVSYQFDKLDTDGNSIHGLVMGVDWQASRIDASDEAVLVELTTEQLLESSCSAYPFSLVVRAQFTLSAEGLELNLEAENRGQRTAPVGLGWHPYLQPPSNDIRHCELAVSRRCAIAVDHRLVPLAAQHAYVELSGEPHDFSENSKSINGQALDLCYWGPRLDGWLHSRLYDPETDIQMTLSQERGVVHVFTSHNLPHRLHEGLALEPNEFIPNAFNRPELAEAIRLAPGETRSFRSRISASGGSG